MTPGDMLSEHFSEKEFVCPDCGKVAVDPALITILEKIRTVYGPMIIDSGCRCEVHNKAKGGKPNSAHLIGGDRQCGAADIQCVFSGQRFNLLKAALALGINRIGIGKTFVHLDISETLPQGVIWNYGD